jgi:hypothetical protein
MRLKSGHLLFILAAVILVLGIFYRQATSLPANYRIDVEKWLTWVYLKYSPGTPMNSCWRTSKTLNP